MANKKKKPSKTIGKKGKEKLIKARQIEHGEKVKASKRKAAALTAGAAPTGQTKKKSSTGLEDLDSVDALFASEAFEEGDGSQSEAGGGDEASDAGSDASSAGAFQDAGSEAGSGDDDDGAFGMMDDDDEEGLQELGAGSKHAEELKIMKEKDPEFYKFLVANDKALLDFRAEEGDAAPKEDGDADVTGDEADAPATAEKGEEPDKEPEASGKVLTLERYKRIQESAPTSFTAFKAALNAYHTAVRSVEGTQPEEDEEEKGEDVRQTRKERQKSGKTKEKKTSNGLLRIDNEATFSEVIEWSLGNILALLKNYAGEYMSPDAPFGGKKSERQKKKQKKESEAAAAPSGSALKEGAVLDPSNYSRWNRVKVLARIFWEETYFLLNHLVAPQMLEVVLRAVSSPDSLAFLWPFPKVHQRYFKKACSLWSTAPAHSVRLLAFLFLRNSGAMALHAPLQGNSKKDACQLEALTRQVLKSFVEVASWGYSWKSLSTFRFMENCFLELLKIDSATTYRVGYLCIRQLGLLLRNACIATSQGVGTQPKTKSTENTEKDRKKKALQQQRTQGLVGWPFIRAIYLWTKAVGSVPALRPLAYPLSMIALGAIKHKLTSLVFFPFVYHCMRCLNRLGSSLEAFVPISSHLLKSFSVLLPALEKAHKDRGRKGGAQAGAAKVPEVEVLLRFSEGQMHEVMTLEAIGNSLCFLATDHLGLLSRSPAFPEIAAPVLVHLRKYSKHCRSEPLRRQLKTLMASAEASAEDIRVRREALTDVPNWKQFLTFDADSALAKAREDTLTRKASDEKARVEAEIQAELSSKEKKEKEKEGEKSQKKTKTSKTQRDRKKKLKEEAANGAEEKPRRKAKAPTGPVGSDIVEELAFSSGSDDE